MDRPAYLRIDLELGESVPIVGDLSKAIRSLAPHVAHAKHGTIIGYGRYRAVLAIDGVVVVKVNADPVEAENLRYVLDHTSLPVPKLYGLYQREGGTRFLVTELIKGQPANVLWPSLSSKQKRCITAQLKVCFEELRRLSANYIGGPGSRRLSSDMLKPPDTGPFRNEDELNDALVKSIQRSPNYNAAFVRKMLKTGHDIVFSHGDLLMKNILIYEGELSGLVDWEYAGFYPEYWDYAIASFDFRWTRPAFSDWPQCVQEILKPFPVEAGTFRIMSNQSRFGF